MAATDSPETTTTRDTPRTTASPLDQHAPPTATTGGRSGRADPSGPPPDFDDEIPF
jgi:hypothetical protein